MVFIAFFKTILTYDTSRTVTIEHAYFGKEIVLFLIAVMYIMKKVCDLWYIHYMNNNKVQKLFV